MKHQTAIDYACALGEALGMVAQRWDPVTGCLAISEGCRGCWAAAVAVRRALHPVLGPRYAGLAERPVGGLLRWTGVLRVHEEQMGKPAPILAPYQPTWRCVWWEVCWQHISIHGAPTFCCAPSGPNPGAPGYPTLTSRRLPSPRRSVRRQWLGSAISRKRCCASDRKWTDWSGVPWWFKQWGDWAPTESLPETPHDARYGEYHGGKDWVESCLCAEGDGSDVPRR